MRRIHVCFPDIWPVLAFSIPFAIYLWSLAPGITFYDSGEFITAVHFLGSAHSPGYPLFLLYVKPFTWLPFGTVAFKVNIATAVSAAFASLSLFYLLKLLLKDQVFCEDSDLSRFVMQLAPLSGSLLFAVSPRLWLQSNHDKPYPLLTCITAIMLIFLLRWREEFLNGNQQPAWWYATAFLAGLATGAHQTIVLLLPGCLLFVFITEPKAMRHLREWILTAVMLVFGGALQLYLPLRGAAETRQNWGDPTVLSRFLWHVLRKGYPEEPHSRDFALLFKQMAAFNIPNEFGVVGFILFIAGLYASWKIQRAFFVYFVVALISFWIVIVGYFNPQLDSIFLTEEFYTPLYLLSAAVIIFGLYRISSFGVSRADKPEQYGIQHRLLLFFFFMLIPVTQLAANLQSQDQHRNYLAQDYAMNSLRPLPENALLFTWGDSGAFPLWYLQGVERFREDLDLPHIPHLVFNWYQDELPRLSHEFRNLPSGIPAERIFVLLSERLSKKRPVLIDFSTSHSIDWGRKVPFQQGIVFRLDEPAELDRLSVWDYYILERLQPENWKPDMDSQKALVIHAYCLMESAEDLARTGHIKEAAKLFNLTERIMPEWSMTLKQKRMRFMIPVSEGEKNES